MSTDESSVARTDGADAHAPPGSSAEDAPREVDEPVRRPGTIPRALLDEHALTVVRRLRRFGHDAFLVGGCVRDLLAGLEPKDFDVVTDATPNRIKRIFRNARIIGRRFRLAHIRFGPDHVVETSTYRADPASAGGDDDGSPDEGPDAPPAARRPENVFGTAPEDARRRDFTINALFYDPLSDEILDWVGGLADLDGRVVRSIGDAAQRIREDPVRMIRAVHFAERLDFTLEASLEQAIRSESAHLEHASPARLYLELVKVLNRARARPTLLRLQEMGVLRFWLPEVAGDLHASPDWPAAPGGTHEEASRGEPEDLPVAHATWNLLGAADRWGMAAHGAEDALALAPLLGPWLLDAALPRGPRASFPHYAERFEEALRPMARRMSIPRRTGARLRDLLWLARTMRQEPQGRHTARMVRRPAFPLALEYLRLDLMARDCPLDLYEAWARRAPAHPPRPEAAREPRGRHGRRGRRGRRDREGGDRDRSGRDGRGVHREEAAWTPAPEPNRRARRRRRPHGDTGTGGSFAEGLE